MEGGGFKQKQVCTSKLVAQECTGRTFLGEDAAGSTQQRRFCAAKTRVQKCTRMYTSGQAISKGLRYGKYVFKSGRGVCIYSVLHKKENEFHHI